MDRGLWPGPEWDGRVFARFGPVRLSLAGLHYRGVFWRRIFLGQPVWFHQTFTEAYQGASHLGDASFQGLLCMHTFRHSTRGRMARRDTG